MKWRYINYLFLIGVCFFIFTSSVFAIPYIRGRIKIDGTSTYIPLPGRPAPKVEWCSRTCFEEENGICKEWRTCDPPNYPKNNRCCVREKEWIYDGKSWTGPDFLGAAPVVPTPFYGFGQQVGCDSEDNKITGISDNNYPGSFTTVGFNWGEVGGNAPEYLSLPDIVYHDISPNLSPTPASCTCEKVDVEGIIGAGQTITLTTYARSLDPAKTKVDRMIYYVEQNGQEITHSEPISAIEVTGEAGRYYTNWTYTILSDGTGAVDYRIWVGIICAYKTAAAVRSQTAVLGTDTTIKIGVFDPLIGFIRSILAPKSGQPADSPYTIIRPTGVNTLQLGTFYPASDIEKGCYEVKFTIHF